MSGFMAIIASIMMLATTAASGRDRAAVLTGIDKTIVYATPATNGIQATWALQYQTDRKTSSLMQTSATPSAGVVLTAGPRGGMMPGRGGAMMPGGLSAGPNWGRSPMMNGGFAGRPNWGHSFNSFNSRPFGRNDFFFGNHFVPQHRFFDRDDFFFRNHFFPQDHFFPGNDFFLGFSFSG